MPKSSNRKNDTRRANRDRRQRLEEMRRQQRAAERRKNAVFAGSAIFIAAALIAGAVIPTWLHDRAKAAKDKPGYQAAPTAAEKAAGCTGVHNDTVSPAGIHVPNAIDYAKQKYGDTRGGAQPLPPSGGEHNAVSLGDTVRFYPLSEKPRPERAVHNLEHGYIDVWYDGKLPQSQVAQLQTLAKDPSMGRLLVVGWWQGDLPLGKDVVITSWGRTDRCSTVSPAVIRSFYAKEVNNPRAPEAGLGPITGADNYPPGTLPGAHAPTPSPTPPAQSPSPAASPSPSSTKK